MSKDLVAIFEMKRQKMERAFRKTNLQSRVGAFGHHTVFVPKHAGEALYLENYAEQQDDPRLREQHLSLARGENHWQELEISVSRDGEFV